MRCLIMLSKQDLGAFKSTLGYNIWQIEKDYLQHLFLLFLSRNIKNELVFKGGTALQKAYGLNRFSIDLDFTLLDRNLDFDILNLISKDLKNFGINNLYKADKSKTGFNFKFAIQGPLYDGTEKSTSSLIIEISSRESVVLKPAAIEIVPIYTDIQPYMLIIMKLEEILAEKVRAIFTRTKSRDIYDLWFLLKKNVKIDINLINKKLSYYKINYNKKDFFDCLIKTRKSWENELKLLITFVPKFETVLGYIKEKFDGF